MVRLSSTGEPRAYLNQTWKFSGVGGTRCAVTARMALSATPVTYSKSSWSNASAKGCVLASVRVELFFLLECGRSHEFVKCLSILHVFVHCSASAEPLKKGRAASLNR